MESSVTLRKLSLKLSIILISSLALFGCKDTAKETVEKSLSEKACMGFGGIDVIEKYEYRYVILNLKGFSKYYHQVDESIKVTCKDGSTVEYEQKQ